MSNNKNKIKPIGYERKSIGTSIAVVIFILSILLMGILTLNGAILADLIWRLVADILLAALFILSDYTSNRKNRANIEHMNYMLTCPYVIGRVVEIRHIPYFFGKERPDYGKNSKIKVYVLEKNMVHRIVVEYVNPLTNNKDETVSPAYATNPEHFLEEGSVKVHYAPDGKVWVNPE